MLSEKIISWYKRMLFFKLVHEKKDLMVNIRSIICDLLCSIIWESSVAFSHLLLILKIFVLMINTHKDEIRAAN